jgi:hypothetical protein
MLLDEAKPGCERCRRAGYQCEGYVQFAEFIDVTSQFRGAESLKQRVKWSNVPSSNPIPGTAGPSSEGSVIELPMMHISVNPAWDEQSMFTSHLVSRLFTWHDDTTSPQAASWIEKLFQRTEDQAALSFTSVRALATTYFAKVNHNNELMRKGAVFYSRALRALQSDLEDPNLVLEDDLIVAIICMSIYEMVTFTQPTGWLHHYKGLARLVSIYDSLLFRIYQLDPDSHERPISSPIRRFIRVTSDIKVMYCESHNVQLEL